MRTKIIFLFLFVIHFSVIAQSGQLKGTVYAKDKNTALSFVNISILDKNPATISDENGNFEIQANLTDTLIFSMVGYQTLKIAAAKCKEKIFLEPQIFELPEVRITSKFITQKLGFHQHKRVGSHSGSAQMAVFVENTTGRYGTIENLRYYLEYHSPTLEWKNIKVRVRLYENDPVTGLPGKDLLTEPLIVDIARSSFVWGRCVFNKKLVVDVSSYNLPFPETGVFVGIDLLHFTDKQGQITEYLKSSKNMEVSFTNTVAQAKTYKQFRGKWSLTGEKPFYSDLPYNACFGLEAKFPAE